jgi:uncharacterized protein (TIGR00255 family)
MTGFGRASADAGERRLRVEIRSVNHRGLDLKIRGSEPDAFCDAEIARAVRSAVERGAVTVHVREESAASSAGIDDARVRQVFQVLELLRQELEIEEPVNLATVGAFMGASPRSGLDGESLWEVLGPAIATALGELRTMRAREGAALAVDLNAHRARLEELSGALRTQAAALPERFAHRLEERLGRLRGEAGFDPGRVTQEVALMAERLDVSEELVRYETHLRHLAELLGTSEAVGRKLDFVMQEIGRELNTIASKAQDAEVAGLVIDAKSELEKMREQAQNVE